MEAANRAQSQVHELLPVDMANDLFGGHAWMCHPHCSGAGTFIHVQPKGWCNRCSRSARGGIDLRGAKRFSFQLTELKVSPLPHQWHEG